MKECVEGKFLPLCQHIWQKKKKTYRLSSDAVLELLDELRADLEALQSEVIYAL